MPDAECPECAGRIPARPNLEVGEIISCPDCGTKLEIRSTSPFELQKAPNVDEDWGE